MVFLLIIENKLSNLIGVHTISSNEELKAKWDRLWHFFTISQKFGGWEVKMKRASEEEKNLITKTQEILAKHGVIENPKLLEYIFYSLSKDEINTCLNGLELILKHIIYHPGFDQQKE